MPVADDGLTMEWMTLEDIYYKTVSYAQNQEDILLGRVFPGPEGFYVDVGANHPVFHSVTKLFYDRGWRGINVEPSPLVFDALAAARPRDVNLNVGLSDREGSLTFFETPDHHGWSTFRPDLARHYRDQGVAMSERPVAVTTLAQVCEAHVDRTIDFLKIDAEGFEREVLLGSDFARWRPRVLLIENAWPETWEPLIDGIGYRHAAFDGLNRFYVRHEDEQLIPAFSPPPNLTDNFIPFQLFHLIEGLVELANSRPEKPRLIDVLRHRSPPSVRRLGSAMRRLSRRARAPHVAP